jgi:hypothetical protein
LGIAPDGTPRRLDDVLGDGFALVVFSDDPASLGASTDQPVWRRLGAITVAVSSPGVAPVSDITVIRIGGGWPDDFPAHLRDLVLLVRPDRYVAAAFRLGNIKSIAMRLMSLCDGTWPKNDIPSPPSNGANDPAQELASPLVAFFQARA